MDKLTEQRQKLVGCLSKKVSNNIQKTGEVIICDSGGYLGYISPPRNNFSKQIAGDITILNVLEGLEIAKEAAFVLRVMEDIRFIPKFSPPCQTIETKTFVRKIKPSTEIPVKFSGFLRPLKQPR